MPRNVPGLSSFLELGSALKILIVLGLLYLLNPVIAHATIRAALRTGLKPWSKESA